MVTITLFQDGNGIIWADYSSRENAIWAFLISDEDASLIESNTDVKYEKWVLTIGKKKIDFEKIEPKSEEVILDNQSNVESRKDALQYAMDIIRDEIDTKLREVHVCEILKESTEVHFAVIDQLKEKYAEIKKEYLELFAEKENILISTEDAVTPIAEEAETPITE